MPVVKRLEEPEKNTEDSALFTRRLREDRTRISLVKWGEVEFTENFMRGDQKSLINVRITITNFQTKGTFR